MRQFIHNHFVRTGIVIASMGLASVAMACGQQHAKTAESSPTSQAISNALASNATQAEAPAAQAVWIDVRTPQEYAGGHLDAASNIPHTEIAQRIAEVTTDKNAEINLYCRSGRRSGMATDILKNMGYTNVHNRGGYEQLVSQAQ